MRGIAVSSHPPLELHIATPRSGRAATGVARMLIVSATEVAIIGRNKLVEFMCGIEPSHA